MAARFQVKRNGDFIIRNFHQAQPFASFFPGIAGERGIPMWVFYVNRGQCICSAGIEDKDSAALEFHSANRAYELAAIEGYRTFVRESGEGDGPQVWEAFAPGSRSARETELTVRAHELVLAEKDDEHRVDISVVYFTIPQEFFPGLVRIVTLHNRSGRRRRFQVLDGPAVLVPYGVDNRNIKFMRRLVESFVEVANYGEGYTPIFKCRVRQQDSPEVEKISRGHFFCGFDEGGRPLRIVVDPEQVFGSRWDLGFPERFAAGRRYRFPREQVVENRLPCALALLNVELPPGRSRSWFSVLGNCRNHEELETIREVLRSPGYVAGKREENARVVQEVMDRNWVKSGIRELDLYARQNFLDNVLRGGIPVTLRDGGGQRTVLHLYSRKHGDLERDYNDFRLTPTPFSQGNGNYRDINQNRRSDLFFNPDVGADNVRHFYNLIQLDGFNPLVVKPTSFRVRDGERLERILERWLPAAVAPAIRSFMEKRFLPGDLIALLRAEGCRLGEEEKTFLADVLACCEKYEETDYGHGFWTDHWTYNLDLLENYLAVYPERLRSILLEDRSFTFFNNPFRVQPRREKYVIWGGRPMQLDAVVWDDEKAALINRYPDHPYEVRTQWGEGQIYRTTLLNKLLCLIVNKVASLDPSGVGVEMEADKPNWYDALNGLPGLFGSSISETLEVKRHINYLLEALESLGVRHVETFATFVELKTFMAQIRDLLRLHLQGESKERLDDFAFWDRAATAKEHFREQTRLGISGEETAVSFGELREFLELAREKLERGIRRAWDAKAGLPRTYFVHEVVDYEEDKVSHGDRTVVRTNARGLPCFRPRRFRRRALPLFLEGPVHLLRSARDASLTKKVYQAVRRSGLYDRQLKMYKVNECLLSEPLEIGRARTFSRGWLENESIWLHMEYKFMLELLRCGAPEQFYADMENVLVPFMKPATYGRSILENSSFIASSANPDRSIHGRGFVARLSGSTAEFIHIIMLMALGEKPFRYENGELVFAPQPLLHSRLFTRRPESVELYVEGRLVKEKVPADSFAFLFLGAVLVCYRNPKRRNTFGRTAVAPCRYVLTDQRGEGREVAGAVLRGAEAQAVRDRTVRKVEIFLG